MVSDPRSGAQPSSRLDTADDSARGAFLAGVSSALASTLDVEEALRRLARLVVPSLADWCVIDLLGEDGHLERVVVLHHDAHRAPDGKFECVLPSIEDADRTSTLARALVGAPAIHLRDVPPASEARSPVERAQLELFDELGADEAIVVGLRARHRAFGVLTLAATGNRSYTEADVVVVEDLAARAALAVDNAQRYAEQRRIAEALQRTLLPTLPDQLPFAVTYRYKPAQRGVEVGGDWYDAFLLPDQSSALVIGDVVGHDFAAALRMGQVRNMLRALAWDRQEPPGEILRRLDAVMSGYHPDLLATAILARIEAAPSHDGWQLRWSNAGHPPPLLLAPGEHARLLEDATGPVLGVVPGYRRTDGCVPLPAGSRLLLYTDGLIERRRESLDISLGRLRRVAEEFVDADADRFCNSLLTELSPDTHDDVALLLIDIPRHTVDPASTTPGLKTKASLGGQGAT